MCLTAPLDGTREIPYFTVMLTGAVRESPPPLPVTLTDVVPAPALGLAISRSVLIPDATLASVAGENVAVTPFGSPETARVTGALKPLLAVVRTVTVVFDPRIRVAGVPDTWIE